MAGTSNAFSDRVGITSEETVANALDLSSNIGTRNIGMLVQRRRGVPDKAILITDPQEDKRIFGAHSRNMYSSYVVESLFNNTGGYGANVTQVRKVGDGSTAAYGVLYSMQADNQSFTKVTTQNANNGQPQISMLSVANPGVGDTFTYQFYIPGVYNVGGNFVAVTNNIADIIAGLQAAITASFNTIAVGVRPTSVVEAGKIKITGKSGAPYTAITGTINSSATDGEILKIFAGRFGQKDPGDWGNDLRIRFYPQGHQLGSVDGIVMEVIYGGYRVDRFTAVGNDLTGLITDVNTRCEYVMLEGTDLTKALGAPSDILLSNGVYVAPLDEDHWPTQHPITGEPQGMAIFGGMDIQLVAAPEIFSDAFAKACEDYCRKGRKQHFIFSLPYLATENIMQQYYNSLNTGDASFASGYLNWMEVAADSTGQKIWIPPTGYVLGAGYIRKCGLQGGYVWIPPAGVQTSAKGAFRFTHDSITDTILSRYVKTWRVNVIKFIKGTGFTIWSSRTYSNNNLWTSTHIRMFWNWLGESLIPLNEEFMQQLNSPSLQKRIKVRNTIFLKNIYDLGGFEQSVPFEQAVIVTVTTSPTDRKQAELEIDGIPAEVLEHLHLKLARNDGALLIS